MIQRLRVEGFKSIHPIGVEVELSPLTLILGPNGVGKSSLLQLPLALAQSWSAPGGFGVLTTSGTIVDCGRFAGALHRGPEARADAVALEIGWGGAGSQRSIRFVWTAMPQSDSEGRLASLTVRRPFRGAPPEELRLEASDELPDGRSVVLRTNERVLDDWEAFAGTLPSAARTEFADPAPNATSQSPPSSLVVRIELAWSTSNVPEARVRYRDPKLPADEQPPPTDDELNRIEQLSVSLQPLWIALGSELGSLRDELVHMTSIQGLRERGERVYAVQTEDRTTHVGRTGARMVDVLVDHPGLTDDVGEALAVLGAPYVLDVQAVGCHATAVELSLVKRNPDETERLRIGLPDTGSGYSQILPVLTQLAAMCYASRGTATGGALVVEQPELHLHPGLQARLAEVLAHYVDLCAPDVQRLNRNHARVQVIAETHSENLVLALLAMLGTSRLPSADGVRILAAHSDMHGALQVHKIGLLPGGRFDGPWPEGFFPDRRKLASGVLPWSQEG